jgi:hypothetical protein
VANTPCCDTTPHFRRKKITKEEKKQVSPDYNFYKGFLNKFIEKKLTDGSAPAATPHGSTTAAAAPTAAAPDATAAPASPLACVHAGAAHGAATSLSTATAPAATSASAAPTAASSAAATAACLVGLDNIVQAHVYSVRHLLICSFLGKEYKFMLGVFFITCRLCKKGALYSVITVLFLGAICQ